jgi:hypothetical protein
MDKSPPYFRIDVMREVDGVWKPFGHSIRYQENIDGKEWVDSGFKMLDLYKQHYPEENMKIVWEFIPMIKPEQK